MKYFIIAGEASGDLHASNLMSSIKQKDKKANFCFMGGDLMQAQGGKMIKHYKDMAFMGYVAVIKNIGAIKRNLEECKNALLEYKPDLLILIDYPSFNLRIAQYAKEELNIPVYYYISPKLWAWKTYRIHSIKKYIDRIFTILPFETEFYNKYNYQVDYVGNPCVDTISSLPDKEETFEEFCTRNHIPFKPIIALLPGSRKHEISNCLPKMIESAKRFTDFQIVISGAPGVDPDFYKNVLKGQEYNVLFNQTYDLLKHSYAAVVNSGTATLETALIGTPQIVIYHVSFPRVASLLRKIVIKVKYISLVNLIAGREVVKELVAHQFTVNNLVYELQLILRDENYRNLIFKGYQDIKEKLGKPGAAENAAKKIVKGLREDLKLKNEQEK